MSIPVDPDELAEAASDFGPACYVLTAGVDGRPRITHVACTITGAEVTLRLGRSASADAAARPGVAVLWPALDGGFSLIADGEASLPDGPGPDALVSVTVTSAVLHRPAPDPA